MLQDKTINIDISNFSMLMYSFDSGCYFAWDNKIIGAYKCRDETAMRFGGYYVKNEREGRTPLGEETLDFRYKWIGYSKPSINYEQIAKFLTKIENQLNLKEKSKYYKCIGVYDDVYGKRREVENKYILIELSPFWTDTQNFVKMSLYTLLLRAAVCFYNEDIYKALNNYELASEVIPAIKHFLAGNTKATFKQWSNKFGEGGGSYYGFVGEFINKENNELKDLLVKDDKYMMAKNIQDEQKSPKESLTVV